MRNYTQVKPHWWSVNSGSGNGLVPTGNKPSSELMLTQDCRHMASLGHNELIVKPYTYNFIDLATTGHKGSPKYGNNEWTHSIDVGYKIFSPAANETRWVQYHYINLIMAYLYLSKHPEMTWIRSRSMVTQNEIVNPNDNLAIYL